MPTDTPIDAFERALTLSAGKPSPASQPPAIAAVWAFTGVEVALARQAVARRSLPRVWKDRRGTRATPLLVVAPSEEAGLVSVVGPTADQPIRDINPETLATEVARLRNESAIRAGRALEESLARLFDEALPGVQVRGVLTTHYVRSRLPRHKPVVHAQLAEAAASSEGKADWRDALQALGYTLVDRGHDEYAARVGENTVALVHPHRDPSWFARIDENGRLPEGVLIAACQDANVRWGMMVSGSRIRLFEARTDRGAATDRWIDLDLATLGESERYLVGLLAPSSLDESGVWRELIEDARTFGGELKERLDEQIRRHALPAIARGLGEWIEREGRGSLDDPEVRRGIQQATNTLLFRLLFILYAESAGHLPIGRSEAYRDDALYTLGRRAREIRDRAGSTPTLWRRLKVLVRAIREGDKGMALPQYNGSLFAADDLPGARLLEDAEVADTHLAPALEALAFDFEGDDDAGLDYTDLDIGHLGSIYEGLLALRLSRADQTYAWDKGKDRYVPSDEPGDYGVQAGQLFFQTEAGGRKGGGVYYTRQEFVRHLVNHSVLPALDEHLEQVRRLAESEPEAATRLLFRFRVLDPAMGSGHFLVDALDVIAERVQRFLAETPLPPLRGRLEDLRAEAGAEAADDAQLLKRLLLKHCIYGVDLQEMAVELARVALWLSSFVPGLALSYLDQNLKRGDSLVGVASAEVVLESSGKGAARAFWGLPGGLLDRAMAEAGQISTEIADLADRTKAEVQRSRELRAQLDTRLAGVRPIFNLWTAEPFGVKGGRAALLQGDLIIEGNSPEDLDALVEQATVEAEKRSFFHWPLEFPEVFHRDSERNPGFDAVIGNPPWNRVVPHDLTFWSHHDPGVNALSSDRERQARIAAVLERFPSLSGELQIRRDVAATQRKFFRPENGYRIQGAGDLDLYELFCERYGALARRGGRLGVVLPRAALLSDGGRGFRRWLFGVCSPTRIDTIVNSGRWAFPIHPQWTFVLLAATAWRSTKGGIVTLTGPAKDESQFIKNIRGMGIPLALDELASWTPPGAGDSVQEPSWELPLLPTEAHVRLLGRLRRGSRLDAWLSEHGDGFIATDLHESQDKQTFSAGAGVPVWKGRSFDQYDPHGKEPAGFAHEPDLVRVLMRKRGSPLSSHKKHFPRKWLDDPATLAFRRARLCFRQVSRATDSRTVRAALVPPNVGLTDKAPYFLFVAGREQNASVLAAVLNSLVFDWQARRYVETTVNYFVLNSLVVPKTLDDDSVHLAIRAARLSCIDDRFANFAAATGVDCGRLSDEEHARLRAEIDALVALGYGLDADDLETVFEDFTLNAVPEAYRVLVRERFAEFSAAAASGPAKAGV